MTYTLREFNLLTVLSINIDVVFRKNTYSLMINTLAGWALQNPVIGLIPSLAFFIVLTMLCVTDNICPTGWPTVWTMASHS
ncbi:hypothetical protein CK218_07060 [Mesorhizobium sp. WSM3879]|nr:hypothetical protein CK218_07060 [Mesorhizobium sp. WSM3879]